MAQKSALSRRQFKESEFDGSGYEYNLHSGEFVATIDCKRWGKRKKLITYMTFEDGRRIVAPTCLGAATKDLPTWRLAPRYGLFTLKAVEETFVSGVQSCWQVRRTLFLLCDPSKR